MSSARNGHQEAAGSKGSCVPSQNRSHARPHTSDLPAQELPALKPPRCQANPTRSKKKTAIPCPCATEPKGVTPTAAYPALTRALQAKTKTADFGCWVIFCRFAIQRRDKLLPNLPFSACFPCFRSCIVRIRMFNSGWAYSPSVYFFTYEKTKKPDVPALLAYSFPCSMHHRKSRQHGVQQSQTIRNV